ncbi:glycerophosphodiester phosphodiesterase [Photobacterium nomapromontoriensis]|uniref:glycerophosphodiester phosphodiesterase n=1 Tax=Photobacterium nomapromontoriensis TaxID=2910237 RepID=UPI003D0F0B72
MKAIHFLMLTLAGLVLSGCATSPDVANSGLKALSHFPLDAEGNLGRNLNYSEAELVDIQRALADRNLYMTLGGDIGFLADNCPIKVGSHRGDFRYTENSLNAISSAMVNGFDEVEIDARVNRDDSWVAHHDAMTGKSVGRWNGERFRISSMTNKEWRSSRLRDPHGQLTDEVPPFVSNLTTEWRKAFPGQKLNIEIKGDATHKQLRQLNNSANFLLEPGSFYFSSMDIGQLEYMRKVNSDVYLGYIWDPDPTSIDIFKRDMRRAASNDAMYKQNRRLIDYASGYESRHRKSAKLSAAKVAEKLGTNSGLHVDIRSFERYRTIYSRAHVLGMQVVTYTINGDNYHRQRLAALAKKGAALPDTALMDGTKYRTCLAVKPNLVIRKGQYHATTALGKLIERLPNDADFSQLDLQQQYMADDNYLNINDQVRSIYDTTPVASKPVRKAKPISTKPVVQQDVKIDVMFDPISISIPN